MTSSTAVTMDFTLRVIESIAFSLHSILGISEPCTGCLKGAFGEGENNNKYSMVWWGWPIAGFMLALCAYSNFAFQDDNEVMLWVQWYIVTFHFGAFWYHIQIGHHPAVGLAPCIFIPIALTIIGIRLNDSGNSGWWYILPVGSALCCILAYGLCQILVKKAPPTSHLEGNDDDDDSLEREHTLLSNSRRSVVSN